MKIYILFFCLIAFLYNNLLFSQGADNKIIDSLKNQLKSHINDTIKLQILSDLNWIFSGIDANVSKEYGLQELKLSNKIENKKWIAQSYNDIGISCYKLGLLDSALDYYKKSLLIRNELNDSNLIASSLSKLGVIYLEQGNFNNALDCNIRALKIYEEATNENYLAMTLNNISAIYDKLNNYDKVIEYGEKAIEIHLKNERDYDAAFCYSNLASAYKRKNDINKSNDYLKKGLEIFTKYDDKSNEAAVLNGIGMNLREDHKDKEALVYYQKAYEISMQINDKLSKGLYCHNLSGTYSDLGNYSLAEKYSLEALENTEPTNKYQLTLIYRQLAILGAFLNNGKKSKHYFDKYVDLKDSIYNTQSSGQLAEMETKYQTEKKQLQIDNLEKSNSLKNSEIQKQKILIFSFIIGFIFILVFSILLYRLFIQKKKANILLEKQNVEISQQKEEIEAQRDEIETQRDKVSNQNHILFEQKKEITDSINYAKRIQTAVLPSGAYANSILGSHFILFKPKDIVSGDFYWATRANAWLIVTVADCTGHGVPGAFMSMLGVSFLNEIVRKKEVTKASDVLDHLRESIIEALSQTGETGTQNGMDIVLCAINTTNNQLQFAGANNSLYIVSSSNLQGFENLAGLSEQTAPANLKPQTSNFKLFEFKPDKQPVAIYEHMKPFTNHIIQLNSGDALYLMSDGYQDQFGGPNGKKFLSKNLKQLLIANCQLSMENQKQILEKTLIEWIGEGEQIDDITILGIKV